MILLANFLQAVARILHLLLMVSVWIFIIRVILSWIPLPSASPLTGLLYGLTEPVLRRIRRFLPPYKTAGFDLSPMIAVIFSSVYRLLSGQIPFSLRGTNAAQKHMAPLINSIMN